MAVAERLVRCLPRVARLAPTDEVRSIAGAAVAKRKDVVHHDLKPSNTVCENGEVSGLFDLGEGLIGDPLEDLARPIVGLGAR